jgi:hypothetical protein
VDNSVDRSPSARFGPDRRLTAATAALALVFAAATALTDDPGGRILFAVAAVVLLGYAVTDLLLWPRVAATAEGVTVRSPGGTVRLPWTAVDSVRADARQRLGLRSVTLEIDAGEHLFVLSRRALGVQPEEAADLINAFDPRRG